MKVAFGLFTVAAAHPTFEEWAADFGYNSADPTMKEVYEENLVKIDALNAEDNGATFAVNQFSGMTEEEFVEQMLNYDPAQSVLKSGLPVTEWQPELTVTDKDWSVSPVKNQGGCGSCWAFGAIAGVEGELRVSKGRSDILSEQQIMDCTSSNACGGGRADNAYTSIKNQALYTSSSYPYKAANGNCGSGTDSGVKVTGYTTISSLSDSSLASGLNSHPQVVAVAATPWQSYSSGIYNPGTGCSGLNHQVYATGVGSNFFKIKNSWGSSWGESGYIRIGRSTASGGQSGILCDRAFYPTLSTSADVSV